MKKINILSALKFFFLFLIFVLAANQSGLYKKILPQISLAEAAGEIIIDWGVNNGQPLFAIENMLPSNRESKTISATNNSPFDQQLAIKAIKFDESKNLSSALFITIKNNQKEGAVYGPKSLSDFYADSLSSDGIGLGSLGAGQSQTFTLELEFDPLADNKFQNAGAVFDLQIGIAGPIPAQCQNIRFDRIIYGNEKNNFLRGGNNNDLIFGFEGNDRLEGSNGNDCLLGGPGNDKLNGSNGDDFLYGEEGDDQLTGSNGNDYLFGNKGDDFLYGGSGFDWLDGQEDQDIADGGLGYDYCLAEKIKSCEK